MREILFRGKRIDNGEWVEGWLYKRIVHLDGYHQNVVVEAIEVYDGKNPLTIAYYTVDPATIGQYTGLTDTNGTNGKKIFEGDIISIRFESDYGPPSAPLVGFEYAKVIWHDEHLGWYAVFESGDELPMWEYDNSDDVVVIGNIHDNPELLKGEQP